MAPVFHFVGSQQSLCWPSVRGRAGNWKCAGQRWFHCRFGPLAWSWAPRQFHGWVWPSGCMSNKLLWQPRGATAREWNYCINYPSVSCHSSLLVIIGQDVSTSKTDSVWWPLVSNNHLVKCHLYYGATENRVVLSWRDNMHFHNLGARKHI